MRQKLSLCLDNAGPTQYFYNKKSPSVTFLLAWQVPEKCIISGSRLVKFELISPWKCWNKLFPLKCIFQKSNPISVCLLDKATHRRKNEPNRFLTVSATFSIIRDFYWHLLLSGFNNSISRGWERKSATGRFATGRCGRLPERFLLLVNMNENFVNLKLHPWLFF